MLDLVAVECLAMSVPYSFNPPRHQRLLLPLSPVLVALCAAGPLVAQEAVPADDATVIIVTADRLPEAQDATLQSVDLIDAEDLREAGYPYQPIESVGDLPGAFLVQSGGVSGLSSVSLRGAPSYGTLVLQDGVPLRDPAGGQSMPNLTVLNPAGIAAIEVLRGPQSGLYGSRAIGGVVHVRPLRPSTEHEALGRLQAGSYNTADVLGRAGGPIDDATGYAVGISGTVSEGISNLTSAGDGYSGDHERDGLKRYGGYARIEHHPSDFLWFFGAIDSVQAETEFDGYQLPDDHQRNSSVAIHRLQGGARLDDPVDERYRAAFDLAYTITEREVVGADFGSNDWRGAELYGSLYASWHVLPVFELSGGVDLLHDEAESRQISGGRALDDDAFLLGLWLRGAWRQERWGLATTIRQDIHSEEGDATTWQVTARGEALPERIDLQAMAGSAFRAPSLYEQFSQDDFGLGAIGNDRLEAEESFGFAVGHRSRLAPGVTLGNTWFRTSFDQRISYDFASGFVNTDSSERIDGVESVIELEADEARPVGLLISHTWQDFGHAGDLQLRLPANVLRAVVTWHAPHDVTLRLAISAVDERKDIFDARLAAYTLVDLASSWRIDETWEVFGRVENLTDEDYELVDGYATPGINFSLGGQGRW